MKVAIDIDGTISEHPEFFDVLSKALRASGHHVVVLTYRDPAREAATKAQLRSNGVDRISRTTLSPRRLRVP